MPGNFAVKHLNDFCDVLGNNLQGIVPNKFPMPISPLPIGKEVNMKSEYLQVVFFQSCFNFFSKLASIILGQLHSRE